MRANIHSYASCSHSWACPQVGHYWVHHIVLKMMQVKLQEWKLQREKGAWGSHRASRPSHVRKGQVTGRSFLEMHSSIKEASLSSVAMWVRIWIYLYLRDGLFFPGKLCLGGRIRYLQSESDACANICSEVNCISLSSVHHSLTWNRQAGLATSHLP